MANWPGQGKTGSAVGSLAFSDDSCQAIGSDKESLVTSNEGCCKQGEESLEGAQQLLELGKWNPFVPKAFLMYQAGCT